ncbi:hypothetical protein [Mycobacterium intracellulare]|uniref:Uncharacterized protein n=1 Tax=Mycobacterium intracellulare TaxID=1767 RepID=A0A7R7MZ24_MYCIT|nr:hypothetical protein [Mycobacterium intracellulare]BCP02508.1 hypothetical protein MINTM018_52770 [Mycobacterium intracellulare]
MSNSTYAKARAAAYQGEINLLTADIRFAIVDGASYTPNLSTHEFLSDIPSGAIVGTSDLLTGKSISGGVFSTSPVTFSDSPGDPGSPVVAELLVCYIDTGSDATSRLLSKMDSGSNLPVTLNGSAVTVAFPAIFSF